MTDLIIKLFVKDYKDTQNAAVRERYGIVASIMGIITNIILFAAKITIGIIFSSISVIADAVNNLSDFGSSIITLVGFKISAKPADSDHPYGHARMEYIAALIISFIILFLGIELFIGAVEKIIYGEKYNVNIISIAIISVAVIVKLWQCLFYRKIAKRINSMTLMAASADSRNDILATSAVLLGAVVMYFAGVNLDGYIGALVAVIILIGGIKLIKDTVGVLLGNAPTHALVERIYKKILSYDHIIGLHDLTVHSYGENKCFASVHCEVSAEQDIMFSHDLIDNIERDFLKDEGIHLVIHLDPVETDNPKINALKQQVEDIIKKISAEISMHDFRVVWGITHSNLIFDIVVPYGIKMTDSEITQLISEEIKQINPSYNSVITIDHSYIPENHE